MIIEDKNILKIADKVQCGERLNKDDAIYLLSSSDLPSIAFLANMVKEKIHNKKVYFVVNRHITHTNICINRCSFCAFAKSKGDDGAYMLSCDEVIKKALESKEMNVCELHIVGGLNPELDLNYFVEIIKKLREIMPDVTIKALTAVEVDYLAAKHGISVYEVLKVLKDAGLSYLPGGGAEVFSQRVRKAVCLEKISADRWLEVHRTAHELGIPTNATILYGHVETIEERVDHMLKLRELQDETGGFMAFIPLAFQPKNTGLNIGRDYATTGCDDLKMLAVSRLLLDNFKHIKAYWINMGVKLVQIALHFGVDDIHGTVVEEKISHAAGANAKQALSKKELIDLIIQSGKLPVERDAFYNIVKVYN